MKRFFTYLIFAAFTIGLNAQLMEPITFEGDTAANGWTTFANGPSGTLTDMKVVPNPAKSTVNPSDSVVQFNSNADADPWVGMWSDYYAEMEFTEAAHTLYMMVYKSVISPCGIKLEQSSNGGATVMEILVPNTLTDEWEVLAFDMIPAIGFSYKRLVVFPDFPASRTEGSINYLDNIANIALVSVSQKSASQVKIFPNPVENRMAVQIPDMTGLTISNVLGKTVKSVKFQSTGSKVLELNELKAGIYFVTVETESGTYTSKFLKK